VAKSVPPDEVVNHAGEKIVLPGQTPEGEHILAVLVKRSYRIVPEGQCVCAEKDFKIIPGDEHYGDPMNTTVKYETDFVPYKLATDVVFIGSAYAPQGKATPAFIATLMIGDNRKDIAVIGDRVCQYRRLGGPVFTDPEPFTTMEIRYERAYGGVDIVSDPALPCAYPRNHLGRGFVVGKSKQALDTLPLPNIEDPKNLLTPETLSVGHFKDWEKQPIPQGLGWVSKHWRPRAEFAGVLPADKETERELRQAYAEAVPADQRDLYEQTNLPEMDFRFFNGGSPGLICPFLKGDESIQLTGLDPQGELHCRLPGEKMHIGLDIGSGMQEAEVVIHTVTIRQEEKEIDLVWRSAIPYPGPDWLPEMSKCEVEIG
jgi:hypothetical protein